MHGRIPIITDDKLVDMSFGTGAVKVTPSHDPNDYECGVRNKLEFINILNLDGTINENGGRFAGQKRFTARKEVIKALDELVYLDACTHTHRERCAIVLNPGDYYL
jgi:valyl-tRNA synthetase